MLRIAFFEDGFRYFMGGSSWAAWPRHFLRARMKLGFSIRRPLFRHINIFDASANLTLCFPIAFLFRFYLPVDSFLACRVTGSCPSPPNSMGRKAAAAAWLASIRSFWEGLYHYSWQEKLVRLLALSSFPAVLKGRKFLLEQLKGCKKKISCHSRDAYEGC